MRFTPAARTRARRPSPAAAPGSFDDAVEVIFGPSPALSAFARLGADLIVVHHLYPERDFHPTLLAYGTRTGTGKTALANLLADALNLERSRAIVFTPAKSAGEIVGRRVPCRTRTVSLRGRGPSEPLLRVLRRARRRGRRRAQARAGPLSRGCRRPDRRRTPGGLPERHGDVESEGPRNGTRRAVPAPRPGALRGRARSGDQGSAPATRASRDRRDGPRYATTRLPAPRRRTASLSAQGPRADAGGADRGGPLSRRRAHRRARHARPGCSQRTAGRRARRPRLLRREQIS